MGKYFILIFIVFAFNSCFTTEALTDIYKNAREKQLEAFIVNKQGDTTFGKKLKINVPLVSARGKFFLDGNEFKEDEVVEYQDGVYHAIRFNKLKPRTFEEKWLFFLRKGEIDLLENPTWGNSINGEARHGMMFYTRDKNGVIGLLISIHQLKELAYTKANSKKVFDAVKLKAIHESKLHKILKVIDAYNSN